MLGDVWIAANTSWNLFNFRRALISRLVAEGYRVVALAPRDEYVERLEAMGVRHVHLELDNAGMNPLKEGLTVLRLVRLFRKELPSLLLSFTPKANIYGCLAAGRTGTPAIPNISGLGRAFIRGGWLAGVARRLYRGSLRHADQVYFQNAEDRQLFVEQGLVAEPKTQLLPGSGIDVDRFAPAADRGKRDRFAFLLVARLLRDKGVGEYVEAARLLKRENPSVEFQLLGFVDRQNPTSFTTDEIAGWEQEGIIKYLGSSDDVIRHYAGADCVVLPSYREGCPKTLLEAASMAIPIVATNVAGCRLVVEDGVNGFLCRPYDPQDLAGKMGAMLDLAPQARQQMGMAGRARMIREFDERIVTEEYMAAVRRFARNRNESSVM